MLLAQTNHWHSPCWVLAGHLLSIGFEGTLMHDVYHATSPNTGGQTRVEKLCAAAKAEGIANSGQCVPEQGNDQPPESRTSLPIELRRMHAGHHIKRFLYKYYALVSAAVFATGVCLVLIRSLEWNQFAAITAGVFAFAFSVQKQNLEEMKWFKELFQQFNSRYDSLHEDLNKIYDQPPHLPLEEHEIKTLFKYFNLCGEEYLYFDKGFICEEAWTAWHNGMRLFRQNPRIKKLWDDDLKTDAYYGLSFDQ